MIFGRRQKSGQVPLGERITALSQAADLCRGRVDDALVNAALQAAQRADERLGLGGEYTVVALAGATGSGKSSLFNGLAGAQIATAGVRRPTTDRTLAAWWGDTEPAELLDWLNVPVRRPLGRGRPELSGLVLLDLPDFDSTSARHRVEVERLLGLVDMFIWVVDPQKYADAALHERYLAPLAAHAGVMTVVLNQADRLTPEELRAASGDLRRLVDADGLGSTPLMVTSAMSGLGVDDLRRRIARAVRDRKVVTERLATDIDQAAVALAGQLGEPATMRLPRERLDALDQALAQAAGIPLVTRAVLVSSRHRGSLATGWPVLSWLGRFRPDPLRRLHLDLPALRGRGTGQQANPPAQVQRTALTGASGGVQAAQVSRAVRALSDDASRGLPAGWATAVRAASVSHADGLADALDHAVATTGLAMGRGRRWWGVVRIVQWFLFAVLVVGAGWMIINALLGGDLLPVPRWRQMPVPVLLMVGSALGGIVVAGLARLGVEVGARHRSADAQEALMLAVARVTDVAVIAPVESELERYEQARQAVATAKGEQ